MKKLLFLVLVGVAGWYGWHHYGDLLHKLPSHEAVIENHTGRPMTRVRLTVDGKTYVKEQIPDQGEVVIPFRVNNDATFTLVWQWESLNMEKTWTGGLVPKGPMVQRHHLSVDEEGGVIYHAEPILAPGGAS